MGGTPPPPCITSTPKTKSKSSFDQTNSLKWASKPSSDCTPPTMELSSSGFSENRTPFAGEKCLLGGYLDDFDTKRGYKGKFSLRRALSTPFLDLVKRRFQKCPKKTCFLAFFDPSPYYFSRLNTKKFKERLLPLFKQAGGTERTSLGGRTTKYL